MRTLLIALLLAAPVFAQQPNPTCHACPATYIPKAEIDAYLKRAMERSIVDQQIRSVDVGKSQVGIGIVTRSKVGQGSAGEGVAEHEQISEIYYVIDGSGTILTGPNLVNPKKRPDSLKTVREQNGPGYVAEAMEHPQSTELHPGDVIVIPAGTGHWFSRIDDHITYLMIRIDPDKVVPTKSAEQSKSDLAGADKR